MTRTASPRQQEYQQKKPSTEGFYFLVILRGQKNLNLHNFN